MEGSLVLAVTEHIESSTITIKDEWEIQFSRYFNKPSLSTSCPNLIHPKHGPRGTWISSSPRFSTASLRFLTDHSNSQVILRIYLQQRLLCFHMWQEEHYVSKLVFSWPQMSCAAGFPPRGGKAVFVSYKDCVGQTQKFAVRFPTTCETESFIKAVKEILNDVWDNSLKNSDFRSEISSQSEFVPSEGPQHEAVYKATHLVHTRKHEAYSATEPSDITTPVETYTSETPLCLNYEVEQSLHSQEDTPKYGTCTTTKEESTSIVSPVEVYIPSMEPILNYEVEQHTYSQENGSNGNCDGALAALPPSFTSLLTNCYTGVQQAQPTTSKEADMMSQIMKYWEDSSFQDMLVKVEKVVSELGNDLLL